VFSASYPPDAVGMVRTVNEIGLKAKLFGGGLVGLQYASIKQQLGPQLNGIVNYDFWEPAKTLQFPGVEQFLKKYQAKAPSEGVDPLGYYLPPFAYANLQVLGQAVDATKSLDQDKLADYLRKSTFKTIVGDIKFGPNGEWEEARVLQVQFHDVQSSDLEQWKTADKQMIVWPAKYATGNTVYPYADAKK
jgi:branched-chain amino acid transport system substrate-binding protein